MSDFMADLGVNVDGLLAVPRASASFVNRLFSRVEVTAGCWYWTGTTDPNGYGVLGRGRRGAGNISAHRATWEVLVGPIPADLVFDHLCRNHACVSPEHGEIVTLEENKRRGYGIARLHAARDTCRSGHPKDGLTTTKKSGRIRYCKTCKRKQSSARYHQRKAIAS